MNKYIRRHSFRFLLNPMKYIEDGWEDFDFEAWRHNYSWVQDPMKGALDHVDYPAETASSHEGDCVDYAGLVASWLYSQNEPVYLGVSSKSLKNTKYIGRLVSKVPLLNRVPIPKHVVVSDGERLFEGTGRTNPNGQVYDSIGEYLEQSPYDNVALWQVSE